MANQLTSRSNAIGDPVQGTSSPPDPGDINTHPIRVATYSASKNLAIMAPFMYPEILKFGGMFGFLRQLTRESHSASAISRVSNEIWEHISNLLHAPRPSGYVNSGNTSFSVQQIRHPASTPPATSRSPLLELSTELRRTVFADCLPARDLTIVPLCEAHGSCSKDPGRKPLRNTASDLMTLNKKIKEEITTVIYEERSFMIHVHQDLANGGIEFLDSGRQPLQYQSSIYDGRFRRFGNGEEFGFNRLKKVEIAIFPPAGESKHCTMNAYYMNLALVNLLDKGREKNRIISITVTFPEHNDYWWDSDANKPRSTSTYGLPNIELALRPFAMLCGVHNVRIELPGRVGEDPKSLRFVAELKRCMMSKHLAFLDWDEDTFELNMLRMRGPFEDFLYNRKYGKTPEMMWTDKEWLEDDHNEKSSSKSDRLSKRRKFGDDELDEDTFELLADEDIEEQKMLMQQASQNSSPNVSTEGRRLGNTTAAQYPDAYGNALMRSLAAERYGRTITHPYKNHTDSNSRNENLPRSSVKSPGSCNGSFSYQGPVSRSGCPKKISFPVKNAVGRAHGNASKKDGAGDSFADEEDSNTF